MMERRIIKQAFGAIFTVFLLSGCYYDVEEELYPDMACDTMDISYEDDIVPILSANCYVCHNQATNTANITLEGYTNLLEYVNSGQLLGAIKHEAGYSPMPKNAPQLVECNIEKIEAWITSGAPDN